MPDGVRLQSVRNFTVRILVPGTDEIVGTGVVVSATGAILTCVHVVRAALGTDIREAGDLRVDVHFPKLAPAQRRQQAAVLHLFPDSDDDIVLLQVDPALALDPEHFARLGRAEPSKGNEFESYGYRRLEQFAGGWANGTIQGSVEPPDDGVFAGEPVQLRSDQINSGMSGAAVLDRRRNLVVGLISDTWFADATGKDAATAWAVDATVTELAPFGLIVDDEPVPLLPAPRPRTDEAAARSHAAARPGISLNSAVAAPAEWVGRDELLGEINDDWTDPGVAVTSLVGFGGEGKSVLARKWLDDILGDEAAATPAGVFWWGFNEQPNVDDFFAQLLQFMASGAIDPAKLASASARAQVIGAMLGSGRYLFVLDGLEAVQYQDGDRAGSVRSRPLAELLTYLADPGHDSYALVTSRVPLDDLAGYVTHKERGVSRLTRADGIAVLRARGCTGPDSALGALVERWDGHALTLDLLASYLVDRFDGDVTAAPDLAAPAGRVPHFDRVQRVLDRYDEHIAPAERALLELVSACRAPLPIDIVALDADEDTPELLAPLLGLGQQERSTRLARLIELRILRYDEQADTLTVHPLVRAAYGRALDGRDDDRLAVHLFLAIAYLNLIGFEFASLDEEPTIPAVGELVPIEEILPAVEAVHHLCNAGHHEVAILLHQHWINHGLSSYLSSRYGAHETELTLCLSFFPDEDLRRRPVFDSYQNKAAMPLIALGRIEPALQLLLTNAADRVAREDWGNAAYNGSLLREIYMLLGDLASAEAAMRNSFDYIDRAVAAGDDSADELVWRRWLYEAALGGVLSRRGDDTAADEAFLRATRLAADIDLDMLVSEAAIEFVGHRVHTGRAEESLLELLERTRAMSEGIGRRSDLVRFHLADAVLREALGRPDAPGAFEVATRVARAWGSDADVLSAEIAQARFVARHGDAAEAAVNLESSHARAVDANYRLLEIDALVGMAWAAWRSGDAASAAELAERASRAAEIVGDAWGRRDVAELDRILPNRHAPDPSTPRRDI